MVRRRLRYIAGFRPMAVIGDDPLVKYKVGEMAKLLQERGRIRAFDY
jgi:hypothetical protein